MPLVRLQCNFTEKSAHLKRAQEVLDSLGQTNAKLITKGNSMIRRLWNSFLVTQALWGQRRLPFSSREQIAAERDRRVRNLVRFAARHVPFYRQWFAENKTEPCAIRSAGDLERLPLLHKSEVQAAPLQFRAESARDAVLFYTSGSTGRPLQVWHDRSSLLANIAYGERERAPLLRLCGGAFRPRELHVTCETSTLNKVTAFYAQNLWRPVSPLRLIVSVMRPLEEIVETVNRYQPDLLLAYGAWVSWFFKTVAARRLQIHLPKVVVYVSESLSPWEREWIEQEFGIPVLSRYNAVECFKIGYFCERRRGFHIHEDLCHVRICDEAGRTLPDGQTGQVVISNLVNHGTVLLNYCLGDTGSFSPEPCPCGRTFRLLNELVGRVHDFIVLTGGRLLHPFEVTQVIKVDHDVLQYQLVQHQLQQFTLTLVTVDEAAFERAKTRVLPRLRALLSTESRIDVQQRRDFFREPAGKFRAVLSHCPQPN